MNSYPQSAPESTVATTKQMHYAALQKQLEELGSNVDKLQQNLKETSELAPAFQKLEVLHSSMFMAATAVFQRSHASDPTSTTVSHPTPAIRAAGSDSDQS
ncbi:hypothetical protein BX666DRAFT_1205454 [Dichotomocladium elegans]|nr:hypothetical protein BX666DRAFT_1205454 [Dichotomocladium elegans]